MGLELGPAEPSGEGMPRPIGLHVTGWMSIICLMSYRKSAPRRLKIKTRRPLSQRTATAILKQSLRRCCLCFGLRGDRNERKGQIAHLNHDPSDNRPVNLVFLCLDHHDEYDRPTRLAKGLTSGEVLAYRKRLYEAVAKSEILGGERLDPAAVAAAIGRDASAKSRKREAWRFPLWQVEDQMELFAYRAAHDGVCYIERIPLPDGRAAVVCAPAPGNPGMSITNAVESIAAQVSARFDIGPESLVWLEHWTTPKPQWYRVLFHPKPGGTPFAEPEWLEMTPTMWRGLWLKPTGRLRCDEFGVPTLLTKGFSRTERAGHP
ncbi:MULTISPECIES: hypothetical protein [unclassified Bradyrhizobium]|uniref:hypothetical protein n=1 Tax=unclassified Bradyrhizobium TaxID=2631580 RepID=UPI002916FC15|nr:MULTISPECIES: hypothetical protein [unclassified Bradyrhizobium]